MGFVLEHEKPWFFHTIDIHFDFDRASIDFVWHFHIVQTSISPLITTENSRHIHQGLRFFRTPQLITHGNILVISWLQLFLEFRSWEINLLQLSLKSRMTAVVRPVSVQNLEFRLSWHAPDWLKVVLNKEQIIHFHGHPLLSLVAIKVFCCIAFKESQFRNGLVWLRKFLLGNPCRDVLETRINWVEQIVLDRF